MPRPTYNSDTHQSTASGKNPISSWLEKRRQKKAALEEDAARKITDNMAKNENAIIDTLNEIDFIHSRIPKEQLQELKLIQARDLIVNTLLKNPSDFTADLRELDKNLLKLADLFMTSVKNGDAKAANVAKTGLYRGIKEIRLRVPQNQPEILDQFIQANARYLESWITLTLMCQQQDEEEKNLNGLKSLSAHRKEEAEKQKAELLEEIQNSDEKMAAFRTIFENKSMEDRNKWSSAEREMHKIFVDMRVKQITELLTDTQIQQAEEKLITSKGKTDLEINHVMELPIVTDPNLMNKYKEDMDKLFEDMVRADAEIDEGLKLMDEMEGRVNAVLNAAGSTRAKEVAAEQAEAFLDEIHRKQGEKVGNLKAENDKWLREQGVLTEEELEEQRQANEEAYEQENTETEAKQLYN